MDEIHDTLKGLMEDVLEFDSREYDDAYYDSFYDALHTAMLRLNRLLRSYKEFKDE